MERLITLVESSDLCSTAFLLLILLGLGSRLVFEQPGLLRAGQRIAIAVFLLYTLCEVSRFEPVSSDEWVGVLLRSLIAAGVALGVSWILLAILTFLLRLVIARPIEAACDRVQTGRNRRAERTRLREAERDRSREQREFERRAPDRERARRQAEIEAAARRDDQRRREDARAGCEVAFVLHAPDIQQRFTRALFDDFVTRYMGNERPPEEIEERAAQLHAIIRQHLERVAPPPRVTTIEDLARWFQQQKEQIEAMPIDGRLKSTYVSGLSERFAELVAVHGPNLLHSNSVVLLA